jgi:hypothetical protein
LNRKNSVLEHIFPNISFKTSSIVLTVWGLKFSLGIIFVCSNPPHQVCIWMDIQLDSSTDQVCYLSLQTA